MADLPSRLDLYATGRDYVRSRATRIDPEQIDVVGSDVNLFVGSVSVIAKQIIDQLAYSTSRLLLDGAEEDDLDRYSLDRYSNELPRKAASAARGTIQFTRPTSAGGAGSIPIGTKLLTTTGIEYITYTTATFGALSLSTEALARATQAGKATQVGANFIRRFSDPQSIFDLSIQINNGLATAGGEEIEDDDTYRERIRGFWRAARRGVLGAIEVGALTVPGVVSAMATEALTVISGRSYPARIVSLYISDSSGVASSALAVDAETALLDYRAGGIAVIISTSIPSLVEITLRLTFRTGVDTVTLTEAIRASVVEFVNSLPVSGTLSVGDLYSVLRRFVPDGLVMSQAMLVAPVGDVVPNVGETIRATLSTVTVVP